ncbi:MAG: hypothetical protein Hyperionvirus37_10 [Hyperionvirus sp.]|uniref:Uncharacterized protein n=1 Tax=Hyperionvirus sp. TaxID=2487770 RepID=A0A3G5AC75_9VIRU|nr:MAG: hypothetical protein Hyperionvirus37_10 [Hyperionvirus sp.]
MISGDAIDVYVVCFHYGRLLLVREIGRCHEGRKLIHELWGTIGGGARW